MAVLGGLYYPLYMVTAPFISLFLSKIMEA